MRPFQHRGNILGVFAQHRVAANLLMIIMILSGVWALNRLNTQFFPDFTLETINIRVVWRGASAEDIARMSHAHPTFAEAIKEAALDATEKRAIHM